MKNNIDYSCCFNCPIMSFLVLIHNLDSKQKHNCICSHCLLLLLLLLLLWLLLDCPFLLEGGYSQPYHIFHVLEKFGRPKRLLLKGWPVICTVKL